jgi:vancomycin resistance protein YoaR
MQEHVRKIMVAVVVIAIGTGIILGVSFLQRKPLPAPAPGESPATPQISGGDQDMTPKKTVETAFVDVTIQDGETLQFKAPIPLEVERNPDSDQITEIRVNPEAIKSIVDKIPEPESAAAAAGAEVKADRRGRVTRIVRGLPSQMIDRQAIQESIQAAIRADPNGRSISLPMVRKPAPGDAAFENKLRELGFVVLLGEGETIHDDDHRSDEGRNENLRLAAEKIDGLILQPGEEFSYNRVVGERSRKRGFKPAGVISNGRVVPGLGGGVCQVSTALFNAILLANLKITERHNHSIYDGIPYARRGRDAAVAWGYKDFRFVNSLPFPIAIGCVSGAGYVKAVVYGSQKPFDRVEIATRNEKSIPFSIQQKSSGKKASGKGEPKIVRKGVTGYTIEAFRLVTRGASTTEERLHKDHYLMYPQIVESSN